MDSETKITITTVDTIDIPNQTVNTDPSGIESVLVGIESVLVVVDMSGEKYLFLSTSDSPGSKLDTVNGPQVTSGSEELRNGFQFSHVSGLLSNACSGRM